mgnify:CR=1 FL=1
MSDYYCECDLSDSEPCEFVTYTERKARKSHRCYECRDEIRIGEKYFHVAGKGDGEFFSHNECAFCHWEFERIINDNHVRVAFGELACALVSEARGTLE